MIFVLTASPVRTPAASGLRAARTRAPSASAAAMTSRWAPSTPMANASGFAVHRVSTRTGSAAVRSSTHRTANHASTVSTCQTHTVWRMLSPPRTELSRCSTVANGP